MKKSKARKQDKQIKHLACVKYKKDLKQKKIDRDEKYEVWLNLPQSDWSEARKKRNGIIVEEQKTQQL